MVSSWSLNWLGGELPRRLINCKLGMFVKMFWGGQTKEEVPMWTAPFLLSVGLDGIKVENRKILGGQRHPLSVFWLPCCELLCCVSHEPYRPCPIQLVNRKQNSTSAALINLFAKFENSIASLWRYLAFQV